MTVFSSEQIVQRKSKSKMVLAPTLNLLRIVSKDCVSLTLVFARFLAPRKMRSDSASFPAMGVLCSRGAAVTSEAALSADKNLFPPVS